MEKLLKYDENYLMNRGISKNGNNFSHRRTQKSDYNNDIAEM